MDDDVTELARLRRRAYGPDADIGDDPQALARLDQLESQVLLRFATGDMPSEETQQPNLALERPGNAAAVGTDGAAGGTVDGSERPHRDGRRIALVVGGAAIAVVLGVQLAYGPADTPPTEPSSLSAAVAGVVRATDASETRLVDIPLDRSLARYVEQPPPPEFPMAGALGWAESLGSYYGWTLWLARSAGGEERCILVEQADETYSRCLPDEGFLARMLEVSVPYGDLAPDDRPARMTGGQSLVYRWTAERGVSLVLDEADITYFGDRD